MKLLRRRREVPGLNTTSTADISFMLLVFFLVTTSMYVDKGFMRLLPPKDKDTKEQKEIVVSSEDMLAIFIAATGEITLNDTAVGREDIRRRMEEFILSRGNGHLITIDASPESEYEAYYAVQNALAEAYKNVRDAIARKEYGKPLSELRGHDRETVFTKCPQRVAENYYNEN